mgnify:CR=1 FL=1
MSNESKKRYENGNKATLQYIANLSDVLDKLNNAQTYFDVATSEDWHEIRYASEEKEKMLAWRKRIEEIALEIYAEVQAVTGEEFVE